MTGKNADLQKSEPLFGESINQFLWNKTYFTSPI